MNYCSLIRSVLSLSISLLSANFAQAYIAQRGNVTATVSPYLFKENYGGYLSEHNEWDTGISLIATGDVSSKGSLEMAAIYMKKTYFLEDGDKALAERANIFHVTIGYRHWWNPYFSSSLTIYTNYTVGSIQTLHDDFAPEENMKTSARAASESGVDLAIQGDLWSSDRYALVAEARYSYSLTKETGEFADQYGVSVGIRYFIQSSVAHPKELEPPKK